MTLFEWWFSQGVCHSVFVGSVPRLTGQLSSPRRPHPHFSSSPLLSTTRPHCHLWTLPVSLFDLHSCTSLDPNMVVPRKHWLSLVWAEWSWEAQQKWRFKPRSSTRQESKVGLFRLRAVGQPFTSSLRHPLVCQCPWCQPALLTLRGQWELVGIK